jgi:hypothetical protein
MHAVDFQHAPPPTRVGSCVLVPIHILNLHAIVSMDCVRSRAHVDATMTYIVGPIGGNPFFDLRQTIEQCWIDGIAVDPAVVAARDVGEKAPHSSVRVIRTPQQAKSTHTIRVAYRLAVPRADLGGAYPPVLSWSADGRLRWSFGLADLYAGRHLEAWLPSNLPFDHFPVALDLSITGTPIPHTVITNGHVITTGQNSWSVRFPAWFTTMSPLLEIHAADAVQGASGAMRLPVSQREITVSAWKFAGGGEDLSANVARIMALLSHYERRYGAFTGASFVCFFHGAPGGMEYGHATTTSESALRHEVIHSWFARGITPASQADGWWDEAFTKYEDTLGEPIESFDYHSPPVRLCSRRPFQRTTDARSYEAGSRFFRGVAALIGRDRLIAAMRDLYAARRKTSLTTAALEAHLIAATGAVSLVDAFHRFVYGFDDPLPPPRLAVEILDGGKPGSGHDNRVRVRVSNRGGACRHFVVVISATEVPGAAAAVAGFDLAPGRARTVLARWPHQNHPSVTGRFRLVASVHARGCHPNTETSAAGFTTALASAISPCRWANG